jgi:hypothetical protein
MRTTADDDLSQTWGRIAAALRGLRIGAVEITVHNGRIVQIERREKLRLDQPTAPGSPPSQAASG